MDRYYIKIQKRPQFTRNGVVLSLICVLFVMTCPNAFGNSSRGYAKKVASLVLIQQNGHLPFVFMQTSSGMNEST